jgi:hypothetical protein
MLGLDVSQCYSPEAELLQHLSQQHLVLAELSYLMDSAGAPSTFWIARLRFASIHRGFDLLSGFLPTRNTLMERLQSGASVPAPVSVPVALETGQMTTVLTNYVPSLFQRHLLSDAYSDLSNLDLPDPQSPFSSKPSVDPPGSTSIIDSRWYHLTYKSHQSWLDSGSAIFMQTRRPKEGHRGTATKCLWGKQQTTSWSNQEKKHWRNRFQASPPRQKGQPQGQTATRAAQLSQLSHPETSRKQPTEGTGQEQGPGQGQEQATSKTVAFGEFSQSLAAQNSNTVAAAETCNDMHVFMMNVF